jgi:DNA-binding NarL/FixJ family response regulator
MKLNITSHETGIILSTNEISISHASAAALNEFHRKRACLAKQSGEILPQISNIKLGLIESNSERQAHIQRCLEQNAKIVQLVGTFASSEEACHFAEANGEKLDAVIVLIDTNNLDSIDHVRTVKNRMPKVQVLMLAAEEDGDLIFKCLLAGASGYVLQDQMHEKLVQALHDVVLGGSELNSNIAKKVVHFFQRRTPTVTAAFSVSSLSDREREVLEHLAKSLAYKEIAAHLGISVETVRRHCHNIYEKMHVSSRTEAVIKFLEQ